MFIFIFSIFLSEALASDDVWSCEKGGSNRFIYTDTPTVTEADVCSEIDISSSSYTEVSEGSFSQMSEARIREIKSDKFPRKEAGFDSFGVFVSWIFQDIDDGQGCLIAGQLRSKQKMKISLELTNSLTSRKLMTMVTNDYFIPINWDAHFATECNSPNVQLSLLGKAVNERRKSQVSD